MKWDVPVWIYWGSIDGPYYGYKHERFTFPPSQDKITRGVNILKALQLQPSSSVPSIFEGSGQKNGERGLTYLTRRACEIAEFVMNADEREREQFFTAK